MARKRNEWIDIFSFPPPSFLTKRQPLNFYPCKSRYIYMYVRVYKTRTKAGSRVVLRSRRNCRRRDGLIALRESATSRVATPLCAKGELVTEGGGGEWERFEINECRSYFDQVRRTRLMERRVQFFFFFLFFPPLLPFGVGATDRRVSTVIAKRPRGQECR